MIKQTLTDNSLPGSGWKDYATWWVRIRINLASFLSFISHTHRTRCTGRWCNFVNVNTLFSHPRLIFDLTGRPWPQMWQARFVLSLYLSDRYSLGWLDYSRALGMSNALIAFTKLCIQDGQDYTGGLLNLEQPKLVERDWISDTKWSGISVSPRTPFDLE